MDKKIKNLLGVTLIIILAGFAYAALSYTDSYSKSIQPSSFRSFTVSAEGKITAIPDIAKFNFGIITEGGKNIADLQKENTAKTNQIIEFIKSEGIKSEDIKTQTYNLNPRYQHCDYSKNKGICPPPEIVGYTITQSVLVKIRDFAKIGDILAGVVQNGANSVSQLSFAIDDLTFAQNQARTEAIIKAKEKAEAIAQAGEFSLGRLLSIEEATPYYYPQRYDYGQEVMAASKEIAPSPLIEPGSQEITVNISLKYEIK